MVRQKFVILVSNNGMGTSSIYNPIIYVHISHAYCPHAKLGFVLFLSMAPDPQLFVTEPSCSIENGDDHYTTKTVNPVSASFFLVS